MAVNGYRGRTVLVGFAESYAAIEAAWSLRAAGFAVAAFTRRGEKPPLRRVRGVELHEVTPPEADLAVATADVRALVSSLRPDALLPLDDGAVWIAGELDPEEVAVAGPTGDAVALSLDKQLQLEAARAAGLAVPETDVVETIADVRPEGFPLMVKPARALYAVDGRLVRPTGAVFADAAELERGADRPWRPPLLVQSHIRGTGEGLFGHAGRSGVTAWSSHRRIRMLNPLGSASSACASQPVDERLLAPAERFLAAIGWRGLFMLEFLRDADGTAWFMELNGRAWGSMALARRRGLEYPAWTVEAALDDGFEPPVPDGAPDVLCRNVGMELVHLAFVLRGPPSGALTDWPRVWPTLRHLARVSRRDRLYNWNRAEPGVFVADTVRTLRFYLRRARSVA